MKLRKYLCLGLSLAVTLSSLNSGIALAAENARREAEASAEDTAVSDAALSAYSGDTPYEVEGGNIYYNSNGEITGADDTVINLVIPEKIGSMTITGIKDGAFEYNYNMVSVSIPNSITSIGKEAFKGCESLKEVYIPDSVTYIGNRAFYLCDALEKAVLPNNLTSINEYTFAFCQALTEINLPDSITNIGDYAFWYCNALTEINLPANIATIGRRAFHDCRGLTNIYIPEGVESIGSSAFLRCLSLTAINVDSNNSYYKSVDGVLFNKDCSELIAYPCGKAGSYSIPSSVDAIASNAFSYCKKLEKIAIPAGVSSISGTTFNNCDVLTEIAVDSGNTFYTSIDGILFNKAATIIMAYPAGKTGAYAIPVNIAEIGKSAFSGCAGLTSVEIPKGISTISYNAFSSCTGLTSVNLPDSVDYIDDSAFEFCDNLKTVNIPYNVYHIGDYAFFECKSLTELNISGDGIDIGFDAFDSCTSLTSVNISGGDISIGENAFWGCERLTAVTLDGKNITCGDSFSYCDNLSSIKITGDDIVTDTFFWLEGLSEVVFHSNNITIPNSGFYVCPNLSKVVIDAVNINIDENAFMYCDKLTIYCYAGSAAEDYAKTNSIPYVLIDGTSSSTESTTETTTETTTESTTEINTEISTGITTESTTEISTETTTESTTEISTETTTESTTETTMETTTEETTLSYNTILIGADFPQAEVSDGAAVIDGDKYIGKEISMELRLSNVENTNGIRGYSFFINYNPQVLELIGAAEPDSGEGYITYPDSDGEAKPLYNSEAIRSAVNYVPAKDDTHYAHLIQGEENTKTCGQLGRVRLEYLIPKDVTVSDSAVSGSAADAVTSGSAADDIVCSGSGILINLIFKVIGEGNPDISINTEDLETGGFFSGSAANTIAAVASPINVRVASAPAYVFGDSDNDGILAASDAAAVLQKALNSSFEMPCEAAYDGISVCDVDRDGILTANDAACILQKVLNNSFVYPAEKQ